MQDRLSVARLLVVQTGSTHLHGDYPRWFERALGFEMPVARAHAGERVGPPLHRAPPQGSMVTGLPLIEIVKATGILRRGDGLLRLRDEGTPVLGVWFGPALR